GPYGRVGHHPQFLRVTARRGDRTDPGQAELASARDHPDRCWCARTWCDEQPEPIWGDLVVLPRGIPGLGADLRRVPGQRGRVPQRAPRHDTMVAPAVGFTRT